MAGGAVGGRVNFLRTFGRFWYDFIVGDDWKLAGGSVAAIGLTFLLTHQGVNAWWLLPLAVPLLLAISLGHAAYSRPRG